MTILMLLIILKSEIKWWTIEIKKKKIVNDKVKINSILKTKIKPYGRKLNEKCNQEY